MRPVRKTFVPAIALGLGVLVPASIAPLSWPAVAGEPGPVSATTGQVGGGEVLRPETQPPRPASEREVLGRSATSGSETARYDNLDQAWQGVRADGARLSASVSADWQAAEDDIEQDWAALTNEWQQLTSN